MSSLYRNALPQLDGGFFVTDGGIETTLIFHQGLELPDFAAFEGLNIGVVGEHTPADRERLGADVEVRAFVPSLGVPEDPVTGSLNAGLAQWLAGGVLPARYVAAQGTVLGRQGRVYLQKAEDGTVWVAGDTVTTVQGTVSL